jgi:hypothetical protein
VRSAFAEDDWKSEIGNWKSENRKWKLEKENSDGRALQLGNQRQTVRAHLSVEEHLVPVF